MLHLFHKTLEDMKIRIKDNDFEGAERILNEHLQVEPRLEERLEDLDKSLEELEDVLLGTDRELKENLDKNLEWRLMIGSSLSTAIISYLNVGNGGLKKLRRLIMQLLKLEKREE